MMVGSVAGRPAADEMIMGMFHRRIAGEPNLETGQGAETFSEMEGMKSKDLLEKALLHANDLFQKMPQTYLKFELHEQLDQFYVKIINEQTDEVIREIPPKKLLDLYAAIAGSLGIVVDKKL
jgi:flagellar protein FlaG